MKLSKLFLGAFGLVMAIAQVGCGPYYGYYEDDWVVEDPVVVTSTVESSYSKMTFKISWTVDPMTTDLVTTITTPSYSLISDNGPSFDGCYFTGTYDSFHDQRTSLIECDNPAGGIYDIQIKNISSDSMIATVEVTEEYGDHDEIDRKVSRQNQTILPNDNVILHYKF